MISFCACQDTLSYFLGGSKDGSASSWLNSRLADVDEHWQPHTGRLGGIKDLNANVLGTLNSVAVYST